MLVTLFLSALGMNAALSDAELLERAEQAFRAGTRAAGTPDEVPEFARSAASYDALRRRGLRNAALERNLGNASLLAGKLPEAILAYRRGLRLAPEDRALSEGLAYARDQVAYATTDGFGRPPANPWPAWHPRPVPGLAMICLLHALGWVGLTRWFMTRRGRPLATGLSFLGLAALLGGTVFVEDRRQRGEREHPLAIIAEDGTLLRKGNGPSYPPRYDTPLNRGVETRVRFRRGGWLQIELAGGEVGWVPRERVVLEDF